MKRVLILANSDSAIFKFRKELIVALCERFDVFIAIPFGEYMEDIKLLDCTYIDMPVDRHGMNPIKDVSLYFKYSKLIDSVNPIAVLTYTVKPNIYGVLAASRKKIFTISNITGLGSAVENGGWLSKLVLNMYRVAFRKIGCVFFQNRENMQLFEQQNIGKGRHTLLPGSGVNLEQYVPLDYPNGDTIDFIFVARLMKEKGIEQYFEMAEYIRNKYPNTRFHICGGYEQNYEEQLEKLQDKEIIVYHGSVKDMMPIYKMSSCTIHPTYYPEGLSNVLLESSACARPIITTDRSGCREVIDDGVNGYIVRRQDSQDLIDKVENFLSLSWEERRNMGLAGRKKVEKEFDRQIVVDKYLKELEKIQA